MIDDPFPVDTQGQIAALNRRLTALERTVAVSAVLRSSAIHPWQVDALNRRVFTLRADPFDADACANAAAIRAEQHYARPDLYDQDADEFGEAYDSCGSEWLSWAGVALAGLIGGVALFSIGCLIAALVA